jgi:hypothetical protein
LGAEVEEGAKTGQAVDIADVEEVAAEAVEGATSVLVVEAERKAKTVVAAEVAEAAQEADI